MITLERTTSTNPDFIHLVALLDADLKIRDGEEHDFYNQFNAIVDIKHCVLLYDEEIGIGCGAIKKYDEKSMEVKRMFVSADYRGKGYAGKILSELEIWAKELRFQRCILETGVNQPEAISLYKKSGYFIVPNYGQYAGVKNSICFQKAIL